MRYIQWSTHLPTHVEHERTERKTPRLQPAHPQGLALCHRVILDSVTPRGSRQDTPGTRGPLRGKAVVGPTATLRRDNRHTTTRQRQGLKSNVLSVNKFSKTQQPSADRHLETYMVAEPVRETGDPRRVVELRERTCHESKWRRPGSSRRSPWKRSTRRRSTRRPSTSRFRRISTQTELLM